jgi:hypothetical protein
MANNYVIKDANGVLQTIGALSTGGVLYPYKAIHDGTNAALTGSAANQVAEVSTNALQIIKPGDWSSYHAPAVNTQATITKASGGAGVRHKCTSIAATLYADATGGSGALVATLNLIDGASGANTLLRSFILAVQNTAGACTVITLTDLNIVGSAATAMTLEFAATPGVAHVGQSVSFTGHDCS